MAAHKKTFLPSGQTKLVQIAQADTSCSIKCLIFVSMEHEGRTIELDVDLTADTVEKVKAIIELAEGISYED